MVARARRSSSPMVGATMPAFDGEAQTQGAEFPGCSRCLEIPHRMAPNPTIGCCPRLRKSWMTVSKSKSMMNLTASAPKMIEETLALFGAPASVVEINRGPTITQFGVEPDFIETRNRRTRVRVNKITSLADDLALALAATRIRIEAPVPGKGFRWHRSAQRTDCLGHPAGWHRNRSFPALGRQAACVLPSGRMWPATRSPLIWRPCRTC